MTTTPDYSADFGRIYSAISAIQTTNLAISIKLASIETTLSHSSDLRGRVETLEKESARRSGQLAAIAAIAGSVAAIVVAVVGQIAKTLIGI